MIVRIISEHKDLSVFLDKYSHPSVKQSECCLCVSSWVLFCCTVEPINLWNGETTFNNLLSMIFLGQMGMCPLHNWRVSYLGLLKIITSLYQSTSYSTIYKQKSELLCNESRNLAFISIL